MPSNKHRNKVLDSLELLNMKTKLNSGLTQEYIDQYQKALKLRFKPYNVADSLDKDSLASVCFYSEREGIPMVMGEIPEITHKLTISNSMTRLHLTQLLNISGRECVYRQDIRPNTPWAASHMMFPDIMTAPSDKYTAELIDRIVGRGYKRPLILQGGTQAVSTPMYLMSKINPGGLADPLTPPEWKVSVVEDRFVEDIIEKFAILDVMQHGLKLFIKFDQLSFKSTYGVMNKYASPDLSLNQKNELRYLHVRLIRKYFEELIHQTESAKLELKKLYLSQR